MQLKSLNLSDDYIFHIHTARCGHTSGETDEEYVKTAIQKGASAIWFSDHCPFPGDPFFERMKYEELDSYISSLKQLQEKYKNDIQIKIGLEAEYLPSYHDYYKELQDKTDFLIIGQHFFEENGKFFFQNNISATGEVLGCSRAILDAAQTGCFDAIAHPDRIFRNYGMWDNFCDKIKESIIKTNLPVEINAKNISSGIYRPEFFEHIHNQMIFGCDAHKTEELLLNREIKNYSIEKDEMELD